MRPRFRLRWAMLAIAFIAIAFGPGYLYVRTLRQRSREYADRARVDAIMSGVYASKATLSHRLGPAERDYARTLAAWRSKRSAAYKRAARYPWTVVPDEPEPAVPAALAAERAAPPTSPAERRARAYASGHEKAERDVAEVLERFRRERAEREQGRAP